MASNRVTGWVGWVWFAAVMLLTVGVLNLLAGLAAVIAPGTYVLAGQTLLIFDPAGWGWAHLILGIVLALVALFLFTGAGWARVTSVVLVIVNIITQFLWLPATPWWSLIVIVLDVFVLWALIVHGDEVKSAADADA